MMKKPERKDLRWKERLPFAVVGAFTAFYGYGQILRGKPIYTNWRGQDISAQFLINLQIQPRRIPGSSRA
jgi:hypothetical protein